MILPDRRDRTYCLTLRDEQDGHMTPESYADRQAGSAVVSRASGKESSLADDLRTSLRMR
jgi:hypothetical protein